MNLFGVSCIQGEVREGLASTENKSSLSIVFPSL